MQGLVFEAQPEVDAWCAGGGRVCIQRLDGTLYLWLHSACMQDWRPVHVDAMLPGTRLHLQRKRQWHTCSRAFVLAVVSSGLVSTSMVHV
eukprot:6455580-Amphidinium_carterae.2